MQRDERAWNLRYRERDGVVNPEDIHRAAIVFDATCPLASGGNWYESWINGGATTIAPTVAGPFSDATDALSRISGILVKIAADGRLILVERADQFFEAKAQGKMGLVLHFQNTLPFGRDLSLVRVFYKLGVRVVQLTYNSRNFVGDGCEEKADAGLSAFGVKLIEEFNKEGVVVDLSHTGYKTTMEAMEVSQQPVVFSHSNARAVLNSARNISDEQIKALARSGGVIGVNGTPYFVSEKAKPTMQDLMNHIRHIADLVGMDHVGLGLDYYEGMAGVASDEQAQKLYADFVSSGTWNPCTYAPPPWYFPDAIRKPSDLPNLTVALSKEGFQEDEIKNILGLNFLRVFKEVWK